MKTITVRIDDTIHSETEKILSVIKKPHNSYIIEAIENFNKIQKRTILELKLKLESEMVRNESMSVLKDFEAIGNSFDAS